MKLFLKQKSNHSMDGSDDAWYSGDVFMMRPANKSTRLNSYIGAVLFFGGAIFAGVQGVLHWRVPGQLFPFLEGAFFLVFVVLGGVCVREIRESKKPASQALPSAIVGMLVSISACIPLLGIVLDAQTQGLGWRDVPAVVTGLPFYRVSRGRPHYTVEYQYAWNERTLHGSTDARFGLPSITSVESHSFQMRPIAIGDSIAIKMNPDQPEQSLFPQFPTTLIYPGFVLFFLLGAYSVRSWKNLPKRGRYL